MPHLVGTVNNTGQLAHYNFLKLIKEQIGDAVGSGWTILRWDTSTVNHELIMEGEGLAGEDRIFVGFRTYQDVGADYYNIQNACMTGYVGAMSFANQPGFVQSACCAHNQIINYWLVWNKQRITFVLKVGTPVYQAAYVGKFYPYARPSQYPYPVVCMGTLIGAPATRFSDTTHSIGLFSGTTLTDTNRIWRHDGQWGRIRTWPYSDTNHAPRVRDTEGIYPLIPIEFHEHTPAKAIYGFYDGLFFISGFNNIVENTLTVEGDGYVVFQNIYRTAFASYFALRLEN